MSWLEFSERATPPRQVTRHWVVGTKLGDYLGEVKWYAPWRRYAYSPSGHSGMLWLEQDCLREIAQFIEDKTREHKKARLRAKSS